MSDLIPSERLQPSLLDRLRDDEPDKQTESADKRVISMQKLREIVLRDLTWLLNSGNLSGTIDLTDFPLVAQSSPNYGMPDFSGLTVSSLDQSEVERIIIRIIRDFEPRILGKFLKVQVLSEENQMNHNAITLEIKGELWANPLPLHLYLKTEINLEGGDVKVTES